MPTIKNGDATLYYEEHGRGFPIFTFAPMGLRSTISVWSHASAPMNPIEEWSGSYRVIVMDQRNAGGQSRAPISAKDNWDTYTSDHIAVLDHLKIDKCHLYGQCIGGSFIANLIRREPQRVASAVWAQPIGRVGPMKPGYTASFEGWVKTLGDHPEATPEVLDTFYHNLYDEGFLYCADREFAKRCTTPSLILAGNDEAHPRPISDELSKLLPNVEYITEWKEGAPLEAAKARVKAFFAKHTPGATAKAA
jgi:pimeloyl-ACP methyl ester carboxylesterase